MSLCSCAGLVREACIVSLAFCLQVRSMDELNHDFQALALEGRAMGEVRQELMTITVVYCEEGDVCVTLWL